ncbi:MAG: hypothetical protein JWQ09_717 [Segetibacter sp.]|nr:hypothetical protein [Segetibacter sp.]
MKILTIAFALIALSLSACRKSCFADSIPGCIKSNIEANKSQPDWSIKKVDEYEYQGKLVYIFEPHENYPDMQTAIIKSDCTTLCTLGGIAGNVTCNGDKFYEKAVFKRTVWQK